MFRPVIAIVLCSSVVVGCSKETKPNSTPIVSTAYDLELPLGLPEMEIPEDNPLTVEKIALGKKLFFDKRLSIDKTVSCASCHDPNKGWSNQEAVAEGVNGALGDRNVPTIVNAAFQKTQFWDGRASTLEEQALGPILNPIEMGMPSEEALVERLQGEPDYPDEFAKVFEDGVTAKNVAKAIASFERTIVLGNTPYDRYMAGDENAMSASAKNGLRLFKKKANCAECHAPPLFTDHKFYNTGVGFDGDNPDLGRQPIVNLKAYRGAFKSTMLRGVADTGPYMHDGSIKTLAELVSFYNKGGIDNSHLNVGVRRLWLTPQEEKDLLQFLIEGLGHIESPLNDATSL